MIYAVVAFIGWLVAATIKRLLYMAGYNTGALGGNSYYSGGMPSAHSATVVALTTLVGLSHGIHSVVFGICVVLSVVVIYDAITVRFSSGEQGDALNKLIKKSNSGVKQVRVAHGHTELEVLVGSLIGVLVGLVVFFTIK